jgi:hypothetical protein
MMAIHIDALIMPSILAVGERFAAMRRMPTGMVCAKARPVDPARRVQPGSFCNARRRPSGTEAANPLTAENKNHKRRSRAWALATSSGAFPGEQNDVFVRDDLRVSRLRAENARGEDQRQRGQTSGEIGMGSAIRRLSHCAIRFHILFVRGFQSDCIYVPHLMDPAAFPCPLRRDWLIHLQAPRMPPTPEPHGAEFAAFENGVRQHHDKFQVTVCPSGGSFMDHRKALQEPEEIDDGESPRRNERQKCVAPDLQTK